jgi:hypothetical protein
MPSAHAYRDAPAPGVTLTARTGSTRARMVWRTKGPNSEVKTRVETQLAFDFSKRRVANPRLGSR